MSSPHAPSIAFRRERESAWRELEGLISKIEGKSLRTLSERELLRLPVLHRAAVSSLSVARAISLDRNLLEYLETLTARSHACVYSVRRSFLEACRELFLSSYPAAVWRARGYAVLSIALLAASILLAYLLVLDDLDRYYSLVSEDMAQGRDPSATDDVLREVVYSEDESSGASLTRFASMLFSHNTQVGFLCFSLGFAAGIPVVWLLVTNGMILGAMVALYDTRDLASDFWAWVLGHGVTELLAITLCATAGFLQAKAIIVPGRRSRLDSLALAGRQAGRIVIGTIVLFVIAALLEGYFRQIVQSKSVRFTVAAASGAFWIYYFCWIGRRAAHAEDHAHG